MFKKILNNQHGMSLMEVMIAASISIVVAMGVMKINETSQKGLRSVKLGAEIQNLQKNINGHLLSREKCKAASFIAHDWESGALPGVAAEQHPDMAGTQNYSEFVAPGDNIIIPVKTDGAGVVQSSKTFQIPTVASPTTPRSPWANNWVLKSYRFYNQDTAGLCYIRAEMEKVSVAANGSGRSFGAEIKMIWIKLDCELNAGPNTINTCVANDTFAEGMWQENKANLSNGMISANLPAVLGDDDLTQIDTQASAILDIFPTLAHVGGTALTAHPWVETLPVQDGNVGAGIRVPFRTAIVFGNEGNSVGFYAEADTIYTNNQASLAIGTNLSTGGTATVGSNLTTVGTAAVGTNLTTGGTAAIGTSMTVGTTLAVGTNLTVGTNATITNNLTVTSGTTSLRTTGVNGNLTATGSASITGRLSTQNNLYVSGTSYFATARATSHASYSDKKLKKDIETLKNSTEKLSQIRGVTYFMRADEFPKMHLPKSRQVGFIAQEIKKIFPEIVDYDKDSDLHSVDYSKFVAILVEGFKEQLAEIKKNREMFELMKNGIRLKNVEQDKRLDKLEKENKSLRNDLKAVKRRLDEIMKLIEKK